MGWDVEAEEQSLYPIWIVMEYGILISHVEFQITLMTLF